ncbi:MAG TPA: hypothetical protein PKW95_13355 [bacterium]|nr:hypothetical protein [bacterium]
MASKQNLPADQDWVDSFGHRTPRCTARMKKNGQRCTHPAVEGYTVCRLHGANPKNHGGAPPEKLRGNLNALKHGAYVKKLLTDEEKAIFEDALAAIHQDFDLNESTDLMQASMAAFYFAKWHCAVLGNADAAVGNYDVLFRKQLECLKTTRVQRDTGGGQQTTPAEWAVALLESVRGGASDKAKKETPED